MHARDEYKMTEVTSDLVVVSCSQTAIFFFYIESRPNIKEKIAVWLCETNLVAVNESMDPVVIESLK